MRTAGVITCYNNEAYIGEAIDSLAPQVDELVVVDDCSRDGSVAVIQQRTQGLPNARVLQLERNVGPSAAFNRGAELVTSDVLVLQGGDDVSVPDRVANQVADLDQFGADMVYSRPFVIDDQSRPLPDSTGREFFPQLPPNDDLLATLFIIGNVICAPSVSLRTETFRRLGPFDEQLDLVQDYLLWLRMSAENSIALSPVRAVRYRKHTDNLSARQSSFDSPLNRRLAAEFGMARLRALETFDSAALWRILQHSHQLIPVQSPPADQVMRWLICVTHGTAVLRNAAIAQVAAGAVTEDDLRELTESPRALLQQALIAADVENLHDRERLFSAMRRYQATAD